MKRVLVLILSMIMLTGCFNQDDSLMQQYYKHLEKLEETNMFNKMALPVSVEILKSESSINKFHYEIIVSEPQIVMEDLQVMAFPIGYDFDEMVPNFNILEKVDIDSFNKKQTAIKLNFFSSHDYKDFKLLLDYNHENNHMSSINLFPVKIKTEE